MKTLLLSLALAFLASPVFAQDGAPPRPDFSQVREPAPTGPDLRGVFRGESSITAGAAGAVQAGGELDYRDKPLGHLLLGGFASNLGRHGIMQFYAALDIHPGLEWLHLGGDYVGQSGERSEGAAWLGIDLRKTRPGDFDLRFLFDATYDMRSNGPGCRLDWLAAGQLKGGTEAAAWIGVRLVAWYKAEPALQFSLTLEIRMAAGVRFVLGAAVEKGELPRWIARGATSDNAALVPYFALSWRT